MERTNLEVDKGIPDVQDGVYQGNEKDAIRAIGYLTGRKPQMIRQSMTTLLRQQNW